MKMPPQTLSAERQREIKHEQTLREYGGIFSKDEVLTALAMLFSFNEMRESGPYCDDAKPLVAKRIKEGYTRALYQAENVLLEKMAKRTKLHERWSTTGVIQHMRYVLLDLHEARNQSLEGNGEDDGITNEEKA